MLKIHERDVVYVGGWKREVPFKRKVVRRGCGVEIRGPRGIVVHGCRCFQPVDICWDYCCLICYVWQ